MIFSNMGYMTQIRLKTLYVEGDKDVHKETVRKRLPEKG